MAVVTAAGGWEKTQQGVRELTGQQLADLKLSMQLFRNLRMKEQYSRLRVIGKEKIDDRDTYVLIGTTTDNRRERLSFDAESGLLLRRVTYMQTVVGIIPEQTDFEDYRDVEGVKLPFTIRVASVDAGNPYITRKLTEIKLNVPVDDSKFNMPASSPKPSATPELSSANDTELQRHIGETVTLHGRFSLRGKAGPFILVGTRPVYLEASGSFNWNDRYAKMEGHNVTVTGVLRFARSAVSTNNALPVATLSDHFYFEAETAKVELSPA